MAKVKENKKVFEAEIGGEKVKLAVLRPTAKVERDAQMVQAKAFRDAIVKGAMLQAKFEAEVDGQKLWGEEKQAEYDRVNKILLDGEKKLAGGGMKLAEGREIALDMRVARSQWIALRTERSQGASLTAESIAYQARFNHYVVAGTVYEDNPNKRVFKDEDDYLTKGEEEYAQKAASLMGELIHNLDGEWGKDFPENKFLLTYKFCDEKLRLIDKDGNFVDRKGRRVDDQGRYINEKGELTDEEGNPLTESGEYKLDFKPFLDDEGNPVVLPGTKPEVALVKPESEGAKATA